MLRQSKEVEEEPVPPINQVSGRRGEEVNQSTMQNKESWEQR